MRVRRLLAALLVLPLVAALSVSAPVPKGPGGASDWPQWRGPNRDGVSAETGLLKAWPKEGPALLWKIEEPAAVGVGYGSVAVVGDKAFLIGADGAKQTAKEFCTCVSTKDGSKVWQTPLETTAGGFNDGWGGGPRSTPTVAGGMVYVLGSTGDLVCLSADKGEIQWRKNLVKDFGGKIPTWGYSESPLVDGDNVIVCPGNKAGMVALEAKTGKTVWECKELTDGAGYASVIPTEVGGVRQYVNQTMSSGVGVRAKDGKLLWKVGAAGRRTAVIPTPVVADGFAFFTAGYGFGSEGFKLEKDGDGTKATAAYPKTTALVNKNGGVVRVGDFVYGHSETSGWVCFDFKKGGDPVWKDKGVGGMGSISAADGMLYCYAEGDGTIALVKATDKGYEETGRFKIPGTSTIRPKSGKVWPHPTIAGGKLFLRDYEKLFVFDIAAK